MPKRCRKYQVDYLQCRMNNGLMEKEDLSKLGLGPEVHIFILMKDFLGIRRTREIIFV